MRCGRRRSRCCRFVAVIIRWAVTILGSQNRVCFEGILIRLVTGCSWVTAERLIAHRASDTTLRARRDEWVDAGVFDALDDDALRAYGEGAARIGKVRGQRLAAGGAGIAHWDGPGPARLCRLVLRQTCR